MTNSEARKRHATPPTPDALDAESLREDIRSVLDEPNPDPTAEWWADATAAESARDAAEGVVREVRALAEEFARRQARNAAHNGGISCSVWGIAGAEVGRVLDRLVPVTTDETEGGGES